MPATKRHPLETFREEVRDKVDQHGYEGLKEREFIVLAFDWLFVALKNGNDQRSKRQWAGLITTVTGIVSALGASIGFGVVKALGG